MSGSAEVRRVSRVLFVCTGNICRSPIAEQLFRAGTAPFSVHLSVSSAGTRARAGQHMPPEASAVSRALGGDPSAHRATPLTPSIVMRSNLILTASREHRAEVAQTVPRASRLTFTLREFDRLLATAHDIDPHAIDGLDLRTPQGFDAFVQAVARMRGRSLTFPNPNDDDIVDPYRRERSVYSEAGALINASAGRVAAVIAGMMREPATDGSAANGGSATNGVSHEAPTRIRSARRARHD